MACIPAPDALNAAAFSEKHSNDCHGFFCPSTAAWYRWDPRRIPLPIPGSHTLDIFFEQFEYTTACGKFQQ